MKTPIPTNSETKIPMHLPKVLKTFPWEDYLTEDDIPDYKLEADNFSKDQKHEDIPFSGGSTFHDFLLKQLGERNLSEQDAKIAGIHYR